jgi:hypothetical protein
MNTLKTFWNALRAGETLTDPAKWKDRQNTINAVTALLGLLLLLIGKVTGAQLDLSGVEIEEISVGIAVVLGVVNTYLTTATTKKIGRKPEGEQDA